MRDIRHSDSHKKVPVSDVLVKADAHAHLEAHLPVCKHSETGRQVGRRVARKAGRQVDKRMASRQAGEQADEQAGGWAGKQTDGEAGLRQVCKKVLGK